MPVYAALLRAINVGGTGMLAMKDLVAFCEGAGFCNVRTYIQTGNVVFESTLPANRVQERLEKVLSEALGTKAVVMIRSGQELRSVLERNPFPKETPAKVAILFLPDRAPKRELEGLTGPAGEQVRAAEREVYIYYPEGMGRSKLKLPKSLAAGTARNVNTVAKLAQMANPLS